MSRLQDDAQKSGEYNNSNTFQGYGASAFGMMHGHQPRGTTGATEASSVSAQQWNQTQPTNDRMNGGKSTTIEAPNMTAEGAYNQYQWVAEKPNTQEAPSYHSTATQNQVYSKGDWRQSSFHGYQGASVGGRDHNPHDPGALHMQQAYGYRGSQGPLVSDRSPYPGSGPQTAQSRAPESSASTSAPPYSYAQSTRVPSAASPTAKQNTELDQSVNFAAAELSGINLGGVGMRGLNSNSIPPPNGLAATEAPSRGSGFQGNPRPNTEHPKTTAGQNYPGAPRPIPQNRMYSANTPGFEQPEVSSYTQQQPLSTGASASAPDPRYLHARQGYGVGSQHNIPQSYPPQSHQYSQPPQPSFNSQPGMPQQHEAPYPQHPRIQNVQHRPSYSQNPPSLPDPRQQLPDPQPGLQPRYQPLGASYPAGPDPRVGQQPGAAYDPAANAHMPQQPGVKYNHGVTQQKFPEQQKSAPARQPVSLENAPDVVNFRLLNQQHHYGNTYRSSSDMLPPLPSTRYTCVDDGACSPRFIRLTTYSFPSSSEAASSSCIPMGAIITPLAETAYNESPVPVVNSTQDDPIRCNRCMAYINPYFVFIDGGRKFICNICSFECETPREHFMNLDMYGYRLDRKEKPEHCLGSYEFVVGGSYYRSEPHPASYVIAIDVTWYAIQSGAIKYALLGLKDFLYNAASPGLPRGCKIAIVTYDKSIHFYNLNPGLKQPRMVVVSDTEVFNPFSKDFFVDPSESRAAVENLLDNVNIYFKDTRISEAATGLAVRVAYEALKDLGGKFVLFQAMLPSHGTGQLQNRCGSNNTGNENEKALYKPQDNFWVKMGANFCKAGVCVDIFTFSNQYMDLATIGSLASLTGGDLFYYPSFNTDKYGKKLFHDVKSLLSRTFGYNGFLKVRVSAGLDVEKFYGNYYNMNESDAALGGIDSNKCFGVTFKHEHSLNERSKAFIQLALLYTTADGQKRLRVHNLAVNVASNISTIFKLASLDTLINLYSKIACENIMRYSLKTVRGMIVHQCIRILTAYRKFSPSTTSSGYLVLPESLKLYPVYALSLLKSNAFNGYFDISIDKRIYEIHRIKQMTTETMATYIYPRIFCLTEMLKDPEIGLTDSVGAVKLPPMVRASSTWLKSDNSYMLDNGTSLTVWISRSCDPSFIGEVFGVEDVESINVTRGDLPNVKTPLMQRLKNIVQYIIYERGSYMPLTIARSPIDVQSDFEFSNHLIEDENLGNANYADFLCSIHRSIQEKMYE